MATTIYITELGTVKKVGFRQLQKGQLSPTIRGYKNLLKTT